ncbi:hypothetical protein [Microbispora sp. NPDC049125]|uniref:hypothetical protein n=1 Tax=Microbispora sp. NPDC049125 TaxID=3154929 RepID=UPI003465F1E5
MGRREATPLRRADGLRSLARSWLPTAFGTSLLSWEIPLVVAVVARMAGGEPAMAVLGVGLSVLFVVNSPALALAPLVVAELDARGTRMLARHSLVIGALGCAVMAGMALVPGLSAVVPAVLGLPDGLAPGFRTCLLSFATAPLAVAVRRYLHGRLIHGDVTRPIAVATTARIAVTVGAAAALWRSGAPSAATGGVALSCGAWAEAAVLAGAVRGLARPHAGGGTATGRSPLVQHFRLTTSVLLNMSPALLATIAITRSGEAAASLVVWPALYGLMSLGAVPLSDVESVGAAFLSRGGDPRTLLRFTAALAGCLAVIFALAALTPFAHWYVADFSGVPRGPADLGLRWLLVLGAAPALWAIRGRFRAVFIAGGAVDMLPRAAVVHVAGLLALGASLPFTSLPGVACASIAIVGALLVEVAFLRAASRRLPGR